MRGVKEKLRVVVYTEYFLPVIGGVQTSVNLLASGFAQSQEPRVDVTVVTRTAAGSMDDSKLPYHVVRNPSCVELWKLIRGADILHIAGPSLLPMAIA